MFTVMGLVSCSDAGSKELVIGYTDYKPMNYMEGDKLVGFDTEFAEAVCKKLGYTPKFQLIEWGNKYMELDSKAIDCIWNGFTFNCADDDGIQRKDKVDFTYAYMNNEQVVIVKKDALATLNTAAALAGKKCSAEAGSAGEGVILSIDSLKGGLKSVTAQSDALLEVLSGASDAAIVDLTLAKALIKN